MNASGSSWSSRALVCFVIFAVAYFSVAGDLTPPGPVGPTMLTLDELRASVSSNSSPEWSARYLDTDFSSGPFQVVAGTGVIHAVWLGYGEYFCTIYDGNPAGEDFTTIGRFKNSANGSGGVFSIDSMRVELDARFTRGIWIDTDQAGVRDITVLYRAD